MLQPERHILANFRRRVREDKNLGMYTMSCEKGRALRNRIAKSQASIEYGEQTRINLRRNTLEFPVYDTYFFFQTQLYLHTDTLKEQKKNCLCIQQFVISFSLYDPIHTELFIKIEKKEIVILKKCSKKKQQKNGRSNLSK